MTMKFACSMGFSLWLIEWCNRRLCHMPGSYHAQRNKYTHLRVVGLRLEGNFVLYHSSGCRDMRAHDRRPPPREPCTAVYHCCALHGLHTLVALFPDLQPTSFRASPFSTNRQRLSCDGCLEVRGMIIRTVLYCICLLYTSPSPRDGLLSRMPSSA